MSDAMETIGSSLVQHGPGHDRAYLMQLHPTDAPEIVEILERLACSRGYSKICAKVPAWEAGRFVAAGYHMEATIPYFYPEGGSACFMAKYFSAERKQERQPVLLRKILLAAKAQQRVAAPRLPAQFELRAAGAGDAAEMAALYREIAAAQPSPLNDTASVRAALEEGAVFYGVWQGGSMVALSGARIDLATSSAELTEFAILPKHRGHGLFLHLLQQVEEKLSTLGVRSVFCIARAYSFDANITLAGNGYGFGGTLTNNISSYGGMESANVWHKALQDDPKLAWKFMFEEDKT